MAIPAHTPQRTNPLTDLTLASLRTRTSAKWRRYSADVLPLWVAEMDVAPAPPVREALERAVTSGDLGYPAGTAYTEALAGFAEERWGWSVSPGHMATVADVITGYVDVISMLTEPGSDVVVNPPVYPPFFSYLKAAGRNVIDAPLGEDLRLDFSALEDAFRRATSGGRPAAYLLCSPHNPTGVAHTRDELEQVATLADRYGVRVVADEIHAPLVYAEHDFVPYLSVAGGENGFSLMAASKAWNLAGIPAAIVIGGRAAQAELATYASSPHHGPTHLGTIAQTAAYQHGAAWLDDLMAGLDSNRRLLGTLIHEHLAGADYRLPEATYLTWIDCRPLELDEDPSAHFLEHARVALNSGPTFGAGGEGHVRLNIATHPDIITEAVRRMGASTHLG
ncbi:MalY/PatB family protein [Demequina muriae]|uniref:cysteine-S-conjugate beta-lyase n=1 Tax=Demequina muriae TaxID=3051664 RepID=A0ABT8GGP8_9MICO|nr:aminotransferase class I/II-fold pyridoxal phosphate-dependent enzyme [Demequina sp. EGI L300058]MDN4480613.1 aminotransferase class I/II-fold pyridoxal phosphate-dependent enzyme [Demequina sp. EGI L300058]